VINGLNTYVPSFQKRSSGAAPSAIVVTGSKQGITNPPGNAAYNASKAAVKALTEHLSYDLKDTQTSVHLLVPGWTFTGLVSSAFLTSTFISNIVLLPLCYACFRIFIDFAQSGNVPGQSAQKPPGAWSPVQVAEYMVQKMEKNKFYIICPDNDVSEETDKKRMLWSVGDIVNERPPLTRWRPEFKDEAEEWMAKQKV
jgi:short-subunit dehydrogenase